MSSSQAPSRSPARRVGLPIALALLLAAGALGAWLGNRRALEPPDMAAHEARLAAAAREFDLDVHLLRALAAVESGGDAHAVSKAGAVGLLQLMPATAREEARRLGVADYTDERLRDPDLNVRLGASYLARMLRRFAGQEAFALAAYNAGPSRVERWRERAPDASPREVVEREGFAETRAHLRRVLRWRAAYRDR